MNYITAYLKYNPQKANIDKEDYAESKDNTVELYFLQHILIYVIFADTGLYRVATFPRLVSEDVLKAKFFDNMSNDIQFKHNTESRADDEIPTSNS